MSKFNANIIFLLIVAFIFSACTQTKKTEDQYTNSAKTLLDCAIAKNDNNLFLEAVKTYREFLKEYPNTNNALSVYMQIGQIYTDNLKNYNEAVNTYKEIINKYPDKFWEGSVFVFDERRIVTPNTKEEIKHTQQGA